MVGVILNLALFLVITYYGHRVFQAILILSRPSLLLLHLLLYSDLTLTCCMSFCFGTGWARSHFLLASSYLLIELIFQNHNLNKAEQFLYCSAIYITTANWAICAAALSKAA